MRGKLCLDFLNTRWYLTHKFNKEILADAILLDEFLEKRHLHIETPYSNEIAGRLLGLRTFLSNNLELYTKAYSISLEAIERINYYLAIVTYRRTLEKRENGIHLTMQSVLHDWNWFMAEIVASFIELIEYGDKNRIKICENPDCRWFFYDETKSRTKRWCDDKCASLMKVRKFRAKKKDSSK